MIRLYHIVILIVLFFLSISQAKSLEYNKISGSCIVRETKFKEKCDADTSDDKEHEFSKYDFPISKSDKIKMTSTACPTDQIKNYQKLIPEFDSDQTNKTPDLPFTPVSCSLISEGNNHMALFLVKTTRGKKDSENHDTIFSELLFIKSDKNGIPQKLVYTRFIADEGHYDEKDNSSSFIYSICDTNNDNRPDIVLTVLGYFSVNREVLKISEDYTEIESQTYRNGGCGC